MVTRNADSSHRQGDDGMTSNPNVSIDQLRLRAGNLVFKSGPLFISSKGIGWTSWKKRWFILTRTSLVFFRSDPGGLPQKGSEVNLTLGGIDLNNSGSVVVRADKKLLTVLFPDGRDGRAFTLKAETSVEMYEWKTALENALAQAPSAALTMAQNGIFQNDAAAAFEGSFEQWRGRRNVKSLVVGRPVLLALEDIDGCPSFLEKALRFIEQHGVRVEGILRQAADVDDVERRIQAYEQGKDEFSPDEDVHVVADCVKHALRELPSSPVPASCCTSLLEAFRNSHGSRVDAMRAAISDTFPDPNRRLLERVLKMMRTVASHKSENRMSTSAVAACMAPLLLRPLLAGDCELVNELDGVGDGSLQLLQAAAAANHAQAIVILLLEEFNNIFLAEGSCSPELYSELEGTGSDESTDDEILGNDGYCDGKNDLELETRCNNECALIGTPCEGDDNRGNNVDNDEGSECLDSEPEAPKLCEDFEANGKLLEEIYTPLDRHDNLQSRSNLQSKSERHSAVPTTVSHESLGDSAASINVRLRETESTNKPTSLTPSSCVTKLLDKSNESVPSVKHQNIRRHTSARKNLSMESIDYPEEDETAIQRFEITKADLQNKIAKEVKENSILQASLERRRQALHQRRSALEQDVVRLQEQLQKERELRVTLEAGLNMPLGQLSISSTMDSKMRADIKEIALAEADVMNLKQKVADLHLQLNQQRQLNFGSVCESCCQPQSAFSCQPTSSDSSLFIRRAQENDVQIAASVHSHEGLPRSEDAFHGTMSKRNVTQGSQPSPNKETSQMQQAAATSQNSNKSEVATAGSSTELLTVGHQASSKKQNGKGELGGVPTQSTLTKLTARLNFLKERRSHLVKELQILGPSKAPYSEGPLHSPPSRTNPSRLIT